MGAKYGMAYAFRRDIPDGTYRVYIDSLFSSENTYVNGKQHGYSSSRNPSGSLTELLYDQGTLVDVSRTTFPNGNLKNKIYYSNGFPQLTVIFYPNNKPDRHWFHVGYKTIRVNLFSEKGYLYEVQEGEEDPKKSTKYKSSDKYKLNGKHEYHCTEGHFTVHYSDNNIVDWKWTPK